MAVFELLALLTGKSPKAEGIVQPRGKRNAPHCGNSRGTVQQEYMETLNMEKNSKSSGKRQGLRVALLCRPGIGWGWYLRGQRLTRDEAAALLMEVTHVR